MLDGRTASGHRTQDRAPLILCLDRDGVGGRTGVCELDLPLLVCTIQENGNLACI
jgi:hypothetical protein